LIDENAQILIIFLKEERYDSGGAILTAENHLREIAGWVSSVELTSSKIINWFNPFPPLDGSPLPHPYFIAKIQGPPLSTQAEKRPGVANLRR